MAGPKTHWLGDLQLRIMRMQWKRHTASDQLLSSREVNKQEPREVERLITERKKPL